MAFDFPSSPTVGQVYSSGGVSYNWDGQAWKGGPMVDAGIYVKKAGDTMTGLLTIDPPSGNNDLFLDKVDGSRSAIRGTKDGVERWRISVPSAVAESGGNAGSDFSISAYDDTGAQLSTPFSIERASGKVSLGLNQLSNVPQAFAHRSGAGAVALGTAAWTKINLGTLQVTGAAGYFDLGGGTGNSLRILKSGIYVVSASVLVQTPVAICGILGGFGYNSNSVPSRYWRSQNAAANNWSYTHMAQGIFNCAVNDYFTMLGYCSVAGATVQDTAGETNMTAFLLAAT